MPGTQRYWDGSEWTEQYAPLPRIESKPMTTLGIARGVALGVGAVVLAVVTLVSCQQSNAEDECLLENVDRSMTGQPRLDCG